MVHQLADSLRDQLYRQEKIIKRFEEQLGQNANLEEYLEKYNVEREKLKTLLVSQFKKEKQQLDDFRQYKEISLGNFNLAKQHRLSADEKHIKIQEEQSRLETLFCDFLTVNDKLISKSTST
ncbi:hypothetical protein CDIK_3436 [Cucumispora dikerogammari]|nr:hypothetical protein CDIK_3436 [Cucumispora dikerogammari]